MKLKSYLVMKFKQNLVFMMWRYTFCLICPFTFPFMPEYWRTMISGKQTMLKLNPFEHKELLSVNPKRDNADFKTKLLKKWICLACFQFVSNPKLKSSLLLSNICIKYLISHFKLTIWKAGMFEKCCCQNNVIFSLQTSSHNCGALIRIFL